jgi:RNA polymerase sigma factor (sigma-70 family)
MSPQSTGLFQRLHGLLAHHGSAELSDVELLRRFTAQADAVAFSAIVRRHGPMILGVCRRMLRDSSDADDAFQATFAVLMRKAASLTRPERLAGWLFQVAYRTARRARAERSRRHARQSPLEDVPVDSPIADIVWRELQPIFDEEVNRLPEKLRLPVVLCFMEGRSKRAVARALGWPEGTISSRLQKAREVLRARLARRGLAVSSGALTLALVQGTASAVVPSALLVSTTQSAALVAAGSTLTGPAAVLAQGVIHSMFMTKAKIVVAAALTIGIAGGGSGLALKHGLGTGSVVLAAEPGQANGFASNSERSPATEESSKDEAKIWTTQLDQLSQALADAEAAALELTAASEAIKYYEQNVKIEEAAGSRISAIVAAKANLAKAIAERASKEWTVAKTSQKALEIAEAALKLKQSELAKVQPLDQPKAVVEAQLAKTKAAIDQIRARLARARAIRAAATEAEPEAKQPAAERQVDLAVRTKILLAEIEVQQREADLRLAEAKLQLKKAELARFKALRDANAITPDVVAKAEGELRIAEAEVIKAQAALSGANILLAQAQALVDAPRDKKKANADIAAVAAAEAALNRAMQMQTIGSASDFEVDAARIALANARIEFELRTIVDLQQKEFDRAKKLLELKAISTADYEKARVALDAAKKRLEKLK